MCDRDDLIRLRHMRDATQVALSLVKEQTRANLDSDVKLALALARAIEIIGEAAAQVKADCQRQYPGIPWAVMKAMRNRLIHAYFDVDLDQVWDTAVRDLPALIAELKKILPPG